MLPENDPKGIQTATLRSEIEIIEGWRDEAGLRVLPPDEGIDSEPRSLDWIRASLEAYSSLMRGEAAALLAHEIEARQVILRKIEGEAAPLAI